MATEIQDRQIQAKPVERPTFVQRASKKLRMAVAGVSILSSTAAPTSVNAGVPLDTGSTLVDSAPAASATLHKLSIPGISVDGSSSESLELKTSPVVLLKEVDGRVEDNKLDANVYGEKGSKDAQQERLEFQQRVKKILGDEAGSEISLKDGQVGIIASVGGKDLKFENTSLNPTNGETDVKLTFADANMKGYSSQNRHNTVIMIVDGTDVRLKIYYPTAPEPFVTIPYQNRSVPSTGIVPPPSK